MRMRYIQNLTSTNGRDNSIMPKLLAKKKKKEFITIKIAEILALILHNLSPHRCMINMSWLQVNYDTK